MPCLYEVLNKDDTRVTARAVGSWCVSKQSHDATLATTPFIYLRSTTSVY